MLERRNGRWKSVSVEVSAQVSAQVNGSQWKSVLKSMEVSAQVSAQVNGSQWESVSVSGSLWKPVEVGAGKPEKVTVRMAWRPAAHGSASPVPRNGRSPAFLLPCLRPPPPKELD